MSEKPDIKVLLERVDNLIETNKNEHKTIIDQVRKTNGTLGVHDVRIGKLERWKSTITGALIVINVIIVPILLYLIYIQLTK